MPDDTPRFTEVAPRVWVAHYDWMHVNITLIGGSDGLLMVDTHGSAAEARIVADDVRRLGAGPLTALVNTHEHWDHHFGNATMVEQFGETRIEELVDLEPTVGAAPGEAEAGEGEAEVGEEGRATGVALRVPSFAGVSVTAASCQPGVARMCRPPPPASRLARSSRLERALRFSRGHFRSVDAPSATGTDPSTRWPGP